MKDFEAANHDYAMILHEIFRSETSLENKDKTKMLSPARKKYDDTHLLYTSAWNFFIYK